MDGFENIVVDDKKLGIKVNAPDDKDCYTFCMDHNYLLRYTLLLRQLFNFKVPDWNWKNTETGETQFIRFTFYDEDKKGSAIPWIAN